MRNPFDARFVTRLSENAHLPFEKLMALSKVEGPFGGLTVLSKVEGLTVLSRVEGLRYPHPSSLRRTYMYASFLGISEALHLDIFHQPLRNRFFHSLYRYERGTRTVKVVPTPGSLWKLRPPFRVFKMFWQIESPSPVPFPGGLVVKKRLKTLS